MASPRATKAKATKKRASKAKTARSKKATEPAAKTKAAAKAVAKAQGGAKAKPASPAARKAKAKGEEKAKRRAKPVSARATPKTERARGIPANGDEGGGGFETAERANPKPRRPEQIFKNPGDVRLLVVDDEPEVLELLAPFLRRQGYTVSEAQDGDQALEKILTERPNIVILDVMMPGLSGWEISRYVRERSELDPVRIIMATGIGKETNAATSPLYGADAYIDKPFRLDALHRTVKNVIAQIERGAY